LVYFAEVEFLRMGSNESEGIFFADAMDVVAISIMAPCALQTVRNQPFLIHLSILW